jgi:homoserine kinase
LERPRISAPDEPAVTERVTVWGPGSLSNLGPGFDALGLCLKGAGDRVEAWRTPADGVQIVSDPDAAFPVPGDATRNTAAVAADAVLRTLGVEGGVALRIRKGFKPGSGIGSSAASAVAGAWAANLACGSPLAKTDVVEAVLTGEAVASGARHGDNVLPALFGGLVLISSSDPTRYRCIQLGRVMHLAIVQPDVEVLTKEARALLPERVLLTDAVHNAAELAFMIDAFRAGDWTTVGRCIMSDRIVEPVRARLVPCYEPVRRAALDAGAYGCALTGSEPSMFAITATAGAAEVVLQAMLAEAGSGAAGFVSQADPLGVRAVS